MAGRARALLPILAAVLVLVLGCGGDGDGSDEADVRECLAENGLEIHAAAPARPTLAGVPPDFSATVGTLSVDVIVERDEDRATRTAADLRGSLASFGVANVEERLLQGGNVIAVFDGEPSSEQSESVSACL